MSIMATCREASALVSRRMDTRLSIAERLRVRLHLLLCKSCERFAQQVRVLRAASRRLAENRLNGPPDP